MGTHRAAPLAALAVALFAAAALSCAPAKPPVAVPPPPPAQAPPAPPEPAAEVPPPQALPVGALAAVRWEELGEVTDDLAFAGLAAACRESLAFYRRNPPEATFAFGGRTLTAAEMALALEGLLPSLEDPDLAPAARWAALKERFEPFASVGSDGAGEVLFTGYYEPVLKGSTRAGGRFRYPLYARPADLVEFAPGTSGADGLRFGRLVEGAPAPYFTREEIDSKGALKGRGLELLYLEDPVDIFFLQVQGSGRVILEDGRAVRVLYAGKNGHPYVSLGKALVEQGKMPKDGVSMEAIRTYLAAHPEESLPSLAVNPSYTFFRLGDGGPFGNTGAALTPGRSIATDAELFPKGAPCLIRAERPHFGEEGEVKAFLPFDRLVFNQDTGGAIRGPGRVDIYFGPGAQAARDAGWMKQRGRLYVLAPRK